MKRQEYSPYEENAKKFQDERMESGNEAVNLARKKASKREWAKYTEKIIHIIFLKFVNKYVLYLNVFSSFSTF